MPGQADQTPVRQTNAPLPPVILTAHQSCHCGGRTVSVALAAGVGSSSITADGVQITLDAPHSLFPQALHNVTNNGPLAVRVTFY